jgi:hypothetical protein
MLVRKRKENSYWNTPCAFRLLCFIIVLGVITLSCVKSWCLNKLPIVWSSRWNDKVPQFGTLALGSYVTCFIGSPVSSSKPT